MSFVTCDKLGQNLTTWLNQATELERELLCAALDCSGYLEAGVGITVTGDGTSLNPYEVKLKLSDAGNNAAVADVEGLFVGNVELELVGNELILTDNKGDTHTVLDITELPIHTEDGHTLTFMGDGTAADPLTGEIILSQQPNNSMAVVADGAMVPTAALRFNQVTDVLTFTDNKGVDTLIDLSQFAVDIHVTGGTFDPTTTLLVLQTNDPQNPTLTVNLGDLAKSSVGNTATVHLAGDGSASNPLLASAQVSELPDNLVKTKNDGLFVEDQGWIIEVEVVDSTSVALSGEGTEADPLKAEAIVSTDVGNALMSKPNGLYVSKEIQEVETQNTQSVSLAGEGNADEPLRAHVVISSAPGNSAEIRSDGLFVPPGGAGGDFNGITFGQSDGSVSVSGIGTVDEPLVLGVETTDVSGSAPATTEEPDLPIGVIGDRSALLGAPDGWMEFPPGSGKKIPYWS